jgi:pyruvate dehydrogenase E2 component (dihydrolipoamide acetyltransferase)
MTISSLGGIGGTHFTPIINPPEVAILGVGKTFDRLVKEKNQIVSKKISNITIL